MARESGDLNITNTLFTAWTHNTQNAYVERNAGSLSLNVRKQHTDSLDVGVGSRFEYPIKSEFGMFIPELEASISQDIIGNTPYSNANFVGGGSVFRVNGAPVARTTIDVGGGFNMVLSNNFNFRANYNLDWKKSYMGQSGSVTVRYTF